MEFKNIILESKIQTPDAPRNFIPRERLVQRLQDGLERLVIISAGMGYGKTVLMTHYAKRHPNCCAWYHLNETDNDIMVFARYLSASISKILPDFAPDFSPYLALEQNEALVRNLALDFAAALRGTEEPALDLILDDFQTIESEWVLLFLSILWENAPESMRLFLCTKSAPPAFCARYLMEERAALIGADALAFNREEICWILADRTAPEELEAVAEALLSSMEGWPAGISFTLLYFRQRQLRITVQDMTAANQQRFLRDYLLHELFRKLPFELQRFLTATSVLTYLRPDVCNFLLECKNAAAQLSYLEQENLFILRLSGGGHIYRYHAMFRSFLESQLQPEARQHLLEQAADFYLRTSDKAQAAEYAIACGDGARLQTAVESAGPEALGSGELDTLCRWLEALRITGTEPTPEILLLKAQYHEQTGAWQTALDYAQQIAAQPCTDERSWFEAKFLQARVVWNRVSPQKALSILDEVEGRLHSEKNADRERRRRALALRVHALLDLGQYDPALELVLSAMEQATQAQSADDLAFLRDLAVKCYFIRGEYRQAVQMYAVLRGTTSVCNSSCYIDLYLSVSGHIAQAESATRKPSDQRFTAIFPTLPETLLSRALMQRVAELECLSTAPAESALPAQSAIALWGNSRLVELLRRAFQESPLTQADEDALFRLEDRRFSFLQSAAQWLAVRRRVLLGDTERAQALCRRAVDRLGDRPAFFPNAWDAFLLVEDALLIAETNRPAAVEAVGRCAPYLTDSGLHCPGLERTEQTLLQELLREAGAEKLPSLRPPVSPADGEKPTVEVRCFGPLQVLLPDGRDLNWRTRKAEELFAYLFHLNGATADRNRLIDLFWPQSSPASATSLLHTSLYSIRRSLTPYGLDGLLLREKRGYRMDMRLVRSPRAQVDALCAKSDGDDADLSLPRLYQGAYLESVESPWAEDSRAWYASAFLRVCRTRAEARIQVGDFAGAMEYLRPAMRQEPYDGALAELTIRCCAAAGEIKNAMSCYQHFKETLAQDLGVEPDEDVTRTYRMCLLERLGNGRATK